VERRRSVMMPPARPSNWLMPERVSSSMSKSRASSPRAFSIWRRATALSPVSERVIRAIASSSRGRAGRRCDAFFGARRFAHIPKGWDRDYAK